MRKLDDPRVAALRALPGVELVAGDFDDDASIAAALVGTQRALLVSNAFAYEQFDRETRFLDAAAAAGLEVTVRISTASSLIKPGTRGHYGRAHFGVQTLIADLGYKVVDLNPNWFLSNWLGNAAEAKASGTISLPVSGDGPRNSAFIDPRDVSSAAAAILTLPAADLAPFLAKRLIEVHGPAAANFADVAQALSRAVGYTISIKRVPREAWAATLIGYGLPRVFAYSFLETVEQMDGVLPAGYPENALAHRGPGDMVRSSPELLRIWSPKYSVEDWARSEAVVAAFAK